MRIGKLDNELLQKIVINKITFRRPEVKTRPGIGEDCAVIDFGEYDCVLSTDPITATSERVGNLAVNVSCNDIASNGVEPLGLLLSVLLPPETTEAEIEEIMGQAAEAAEKIGVEIIGGHTEITSAVNQPVITATAIGRAVSRADSFYGPDGEILGNHNRKREIDSGDRLIVTKLLAMEGTGIIAASHENELSNVLSADEFDEAITMLDNISVVNDGVTAARAGVRDMHDITEGGVLGAIWELCELHNVGAEILEANLPVSDVTRKVCSHFDIDPLRLISSGSMLIAAPKNTADNVITALAEVGVRATEIGKITERARGIKLVKHDGSVSVIDAPKSDEIYKL
jgi:hydrogenase expression/formation protein HypE